MFLPLLMRKIFGIQEQNIHWKYIIVIQ